MLGVPGGKVILVPWTKQWEIEFLSEKNVIETEIGELVIAVHHIGSTAVKNLSGKPIIDIAIEIEDKDSGAAIKGLESLGYVHKPDAALPERHYLTKGSPRTHQIHMFNKGNPFIRKHLAFRDYLRTNENERVRYEQLKVDLANTHSNNRIAYADGKTDFVNEILLKIGL
ncbi:GrpB family protein [Paenibacillus sp. Soil522]|uniref:GrpB family protein n=1 Tax=Paenibacillus sp. Soil522 TaxID=1736388 RepID=UPI0006FADC53|nr:GrpB family protein [Paenibacillus sp. Soil522]KRE37333.1 hypothetical protein ASG81_20235 [Paenibacillus sp. Soil522]